MRRAKSWPIEELRQAIDCLPVRTRVAMLDGVRSNAIIAGAYTDRSGGVCPMLAAHRCGGRTDLLAFAHAWDRFTGARRRARRATERELRILTIHLEESLLAEDPSLDLREALDEHRASLERSRARAGDPNRTAELKHRPGWSWLRPFKRWDEYERALARVEAQRSEAAADAERETELV
jgi:hypothetical protein